MNNVHPLFADILKAHVNPKQGAFSENGKTDPRECEHDWTVSHYSYVAPSRDPYDRPDLVYWKCTKCGAEDCEEFQ